MATPKKSVAKETAQEKERGKGNGSKSPLEFTREKELMALRDILLLRRFEEKAGQLYGMGAIGGFCHLYIGQEAIVVGMQMALKKGDQVITGYRDHGHMLATGMEAKGAMAAIPMARAAPCTCSARRRTSSAATALSARRCRSAPDLLSPIAIAATILSVWPISATARRTRDRSMRVSTWRSCGSSR